MWTPRPLTKTEQELEDACAAACAAQSVDAIEMAVRSVYVIDPATMEMIDDEARQKVMWLGQLLAPPVATDDDRLADLYDTLRRLLPGTNADGSQLSDADILARAVDEIITLRTDAESAAWRGVATDPPPLRCAALLAHHYPLWVGEARAITYSPSPGEEAHEIAYYEDGDFSDCVAPTAWAILPILEDE